MGLSALGWRGTRSEPKLPPGTLAVSWHSCNPNGWALPGYHWRGFWAGSTGTREPPPPERAASSCTRRNHRGVGAPEVGGAVGGDSEGRGRGREDAGEVGGAREGMLREMGGAVAGTLERLGGAVGRWGQ